MINRRSTGRSSSIVASKVREGKDDFGFNAATEKFEALRAAGVIDPTKVVRMALQHAASVSGLFITTEAAIAEKPKKKDKGDGDGGEMDDFDEDY